VNRKASVSRAPPLRTPSTCVFSDAVETEVETLSNPTTNEKVLLLKSLNPSNCELQKISACERLKALIKSAHSQVVLEPEVLAALIALLKEPHLKDEEPSSVFGAVLETLSTLALSPEGVCVCMCVCVCVCIVLLVLHPPAVPRPAKGVLVWSVRPSHQVGSSGCLAVFSC
jgi:hypothetical protein